MSAGQANRPGAPGVRRGAGRQACETYTRKNRRDKPVTIENNPKEIAAMEEFHKGNRAEGLRLQEEFASAFREE